MEVNERSAKILEAAVREFIESGEPVSSEVLYERYGFGIKPASIRSELLRLTENGLLEQLHTSGGRVPTEKGYQFLVNHLMDKIFDSDRESTRAPNVRPALLEENLPSFVDEVADEFKMLSIGYAPENEGVYKSGLDELCERIDFESKEDFLEIVHDFEALDGMIEHIIGKLSRLKIPGVFLGQESPITKSRHLAVIADYYEIDGKPVVFAAVGPKRMDYNKPLQLFKAMRKKYKNH